MTTTLTLGEAVTLQMDLEDMMQEQRAGRMKGEQRLSPYTDRVLVALLKRELAGRHSASIGDEFAYECMCSTQTLSKVLGWLMERGFVERRREGRSIVYASQHDLQRAPLSSGEEEERLFEGALGRFYNPFVETHEHQLELLLAGPDCRARRVAQRIRPDDDE